MNVLTQRFRLPSLFACALALLAFAGCTHEKEYVPESDPKKPLPPTMQAYGEFFEGKLMVEASLGRGFRMRPGKMKEYESRRGRNENAFADVYYIGEQEEEQEDQYYIPRMNNSTLPPVALRVRVTNQTQAPVDVEFIECDSMLGNFAVRPEKITVAASETGMPDPMVSLLGVTGDEIQLKIGLKLGDAKETKIIMLRVIKGLKPPPEGKGKRGAPPPPPAQ